MRIENRARHHEIQRGKEQVDQQVDADDHQEESRPRQRQYHVIDIAPMPARDTDTLALHHGKARIGAPVKARPIAFGLLRHPEAPV